MRGALARPLDGRVFFAGVLIAFLLTIPLVNLVVPVVATMFITYWVMLAGTKGGSA